MRENIIHINSSLRLCFLNSLNEKEYLLFIDYIGYAVCLSKYRLL